MINGISKILGKNAKVNLMKIVVGTWQDLAPAAKGIREQVFIQEQNIAEIDEWDDLDAIAVHFILYQQQQVLATARLLGNDSIGRVAVLKAARGQGLGEALMRFVIDYAQQQGRPSVHLSAQVHAVAFYQRLGFEVKGEPYIDCNIPHIQMQLVF